MKFAGPERRVPPDEVLRSVMEAYERGQCLEALRRAETFAPLADWGGIQPLTIASRLALCVGAPQLARVLAVRNWRTDPAHPLAQFEFAIQYLQQRGPLLFWHHSVRWPKVAGGTEQWQGDLIALRGFVASELRDFDLAEKLLAQAEALAPGVPWIRLQRAHLLERLDQVEAALEVAREVLRQQPHPHYRPAIQIISHLYQMLDRDDDAIELLQGATEVLENAPLAGQLYGLLAENHHWPEAAIALERYVHFSPLLEKPLQQWVAGQRARVNYFLGKRPEAAGFAQAAGDDFNLAFAQRLETPASEAERVRLEVPFVRQHFKTCAPATQAALGRFWRMPDDHLKLVEAVCYDGTPRWKQRDWSEQNGWLVREFSVTWESAVALLTRGIPFAISTVNATSAHMQAVMGFDRTRQTLNLRDPSQPYSVEWPAEKFFKLYQPFGPQGLLLLPWAESGRLDGIDLPDAELCDEQHAVELALIRHDRAAAQAVAERLAAKYPDHPITWQVRQQLAGYDANSAEEARCLDRLLELFPNTPARVLRRLAVMRTASREEKIVFLEQTCLRQAADPAVCFEMARLLSADAQQRPEARRWLRWGLRGRPVDSGGAMVLADLTWHEGRYAEATELYRMAATLEDFREQSYRAWFIACRQIRQTDPALEHLRARFQRFGKRSAQPALTLAWALQELEQLQSARAVLAEALELRPEDTHLTLRAAVLQARLGHPEVASAWLEGARGKVRENDRLRVGAEIAEILSDTAGALRHSRELLALEPLAIDAHHCVARCLSVLKGNSAALAHLRQACADHPSHCALWRMLIEWTRGTDSGAVLSAADKILKISPGDAWTRRERAWALARQNRLAEGLEEAQEADRIEPRNSASHSLMAHILVLLRRPEEARAQFRRAVELAVDNNQAIEGLLSLAPGDKERKEELLFIERELVSQVVFGDGLLAFGEVARPLLDPETLLDLLRRAHREHPHLWHVWLALIEQLVHRGQYDEALPLALKATERFPHLPRAWVELALIHRHRQEPAEEIAAAQRAFEINPAWNRAATYLGGAWERQRKLEEARDVYERALHHQPKDPVLQARLGSILWQLRRPDDALARMEQALQFAPDYYWAWSHLRDWSSQNGQPERLDQFARELTRQRPGEARVWILLARTLRGPQSHSERIAAVDRALALEPYANDHWDLKMELLAEDQDYEAALETGRQALAACSSNQFMLHGRLAWIEAQRGKIDEAIQNLRGVLAENAGYVWGWQQLCVWLVQQQAYADAETAIEQLLKLHPNDTWAQRQLAAVRLKRDDRPGAEAVYRTVLQTSPTDRTAAESLFDLQLESANLTGAAETLHRIQVHQPGASTLAREIMLALRQGNTRNALELFKTLISQRDPDPWPIHAAFKAFKSAGREGKALKLIWQALQSSDCNPQIGLIAIQYRLDAGRYLRAVWQFGRIRSVRARQLAAPTLIKKLVEARSRLLLRALIWRQRHILHQDDQSWGQVGYALATFNRMRAAVEWMNDWQSRSNLEPWMLFNLGYALRTLGHYTEAGRIVQFAIGRWGHHHQNSADLRLFLAIEQALAGETEAARENLKQSNIRSNVIYDRQIEAITQALVEFQQLPAEKRARSFGAVIQRLEPHFKAWQFLRGERDVRRTFRRAARFMGQSGAGWRMRWWFVWKLNWHWLLLLAVPVAVGAIALAGSGVPAPAVVVPVMLVFMLRSLLQSSRGYK